MNINIKFLNKEIKQKVESFFKNGNFYKEVLVKTIIKEKISNPTIEKFNFDYDVVIFKISDKNSITHEIKIDLFSDSISSLVTVKRYDKSFYKTYRIINDTLIIDSKIYIRNNQKLEKVYRNDNILEYNFINSYLDSKIYLVLKDNQNFEEILLIKNILDNEEIKDISTLYKKFSSILNIEKININNQNSLYNEKILVVSDELKEYKRCILKEDGVEYLDYRGGKIFVTREEKENLELDKMKKIVK